MEQQMPPSIFATSNLPIYSTNIAVEKRKIDNILKFDEGVTVNTVMRWKKSKKINVDCFLGFNDDASEGERIKGSEILAQSGHFYCTLCDSYVRGNKKSAMRHQIKNRKHVAYTTGQSGETSTEEAETMADFKVPKVYPKVATASYEPFSSCSTDAAQQPTMMTVSHATLPTQEAWNILQNPIKVQDVESLRSLLVSLGVCEGSDLLLCHGEELRAVAGTLKKVPQRRFLQIFEKHCEGQVVTVPTE